MTLFEGKKVLISVNR